MNFRRLEGGQSHEQKDITQEIEEVKLLEKTPRLEPYQSRTLIEKLLRNEQQELWTKVVQRCLVETSFFDEYDEASLLEWISKKGEVDFPSRFSVTGMYHSGTYSRLEGIEIKGSPPTPKDYLLSLASYAALPLNAEIMNHELIHAMQFNPPKTEGLIAQLQLFARKALLLEDHLVNAMLDEATELTEVHAWRATIARLIPSIRTIKYIQGEYKGDLNKIIDAALIVERARAIGITDEELAQTIRQNFNWSKPKKESDLTWVLDPENPQYKSVQETAKKEGWSVTWAEEYVYATETGGCFLDLHKWLNNECVRRGLSPKDLELKVSEARLQQRKNELAAALICQEEIITAVGEKTPDIDERLVTPPAKRFVVDRRNITERQTAATVAERIKEIEHVIGENFAKAEEILTTSLTETEPRSIPLRLKLKARFNSLKSEDRTNETSLMFLNEIFKEVKARELRNLPPFIHAFAWNPEVLRNNERTQVLDNLIFLLENYYSRTEAESFCQIKLEKSPAEIALWLGLIHWKMGTLEKAREWYISGYNWLEEAINNVMTLQFAGQSHSHLVQKREEVLRTIKSLESNF